MDIVTRAKNICLTPATEWPVIAEEHTPAGTLASGYVAPLAAIAAVAGLIGGSIIGRTVPFIGHYRVPIVSGLVAAIFTIVMAIVSTFVIGFIIDALAPSFDGQKNSEQAYKIAAYSYTPAWIAGVLNILPFFGVLALLGALYGLYLLYLGLPKLMKCPEDKALGYTVVVVLCAIVLSIIVGMISAAIVGTSMMASGALSSIGRSSNDDVQFDKNSPLGKMQEISKKLDESNKKMEAAAKAGDANAQMNAAVEGLGTLLGGGKRVDPMDIDALKAYAPGTFAGLPRTEISGDKSGMASLMVSKTRATYSDGAGKSVNLEITDTGGVSGMMGLASWVGVREQHDDANASERTDKIDGRIVHEKMSKTGGSNEYGIVLGDRFVVSATGSRVDLPTLKSAVSSMDLAKLEAMKDEGTKK